MAHKFGREYLMRERSINIDTVADAERQGFLAYAYGAVAFIGRAIGGLIKSATLRLIDQKQDQPNKRDARGSTKAYAPILHGDAGSKTVWIVEGGTDALALHDIAVRTGQLRPTVIVSGGAGALSFMDMPHIQQILKSAERVTVAFDREKSLAVQDKTDDGHKKQIEKLASLGVAVRAWAPPEGVKDIAELNAEQALRGRGDDDDVHGPGGR
jgi:hypothetical protein